MKFYPFFFDDYVKVDMVIKFSLKKICSVAHFSGELALPSLDGSDGGFSDTAYKLSDGEQIEGGVAGAPRLTITKTPRRRQKTQGPSDTAFEITCNKLVTWFNQNDILKAINNDQIADFHGLEKELQNFFWDFVHLQRYSEALKKDGSVDALAKDSDVWGKVRQCIVLSSHDWFVDEYEKIRLGAEINVLRSTKSDQPISPKEKEMVRRCLANFSVKKAQLFFRPTLEKVADLVNGSDNYVEKLDWAIGRTGNLQDAKVLSWLLKSSLVIPNSLIRSFVMNKVKSYFTEDDFKRLNIERTVEKFLLDLAKFGIIHYSTPWF